MKWYKEIVREWSKKKFELDYDKMMRLFEAACYPKQGLKSIDEENDFWKRYYEELLREKG